MSSSPDLPPRRRSGALFAFGLILTLALAGLAILLPPKGREHGDFLQFLGRFHPIVVHLPIAFLALVPAMELLGCLPRRAHLRAAAGFVLDCAAIGALFAAIDGWLLAWSGGYGGPLVRHHMWGGIALAALTLAVAWLRRSWAEKSRLVFFPVYAPLLAAAVGLMAWTGHEGGSITHGDDYLVQYMPGRLRGWLRIAPPPAPPPPPAVAPGAAATVYGARIQPILQHSCVSCHNPKRIKGGLRLDSYAALMSGGEDGPAVVPWAPGKSDLLRRVTLPQDDDDFMPSNGRNVLTPAEVDLLRRWIAAGASSAQPLDTLQASK